MVIETIKIDWIKKRHYVCFFFGLVYTFIGYALGNYIFKDNISIAMLFLATLLLIPTLVKLIEWEENIERKEGIKHFFRNHRDIFEAYILLFLGIFIGYVILGFTIGNFGEIFSYQISFLEKQQGLNSEVIQGFYSEPLQNSFENVKNIISNNLTVILITLILSFFYGVGAVFLIVLNSSVFAAFVVYVSNEINLTINGIFKILGYFSIHLIPEITGFLLAAIAGGVISRAVTNEKFMSEEFRNVIRDSIIILSISIFLIILGAFLEVFVTSKLFHSL